MAEPSFRQDATIHGLIAEQALATPNGIALITDQEQLTYTELMSRARLLARFLVEQGVGVEEPVGVCLERSADLPVALLAVFMAGGCYLPLDPNYPRERIAFMLDDAKSRFVITRRGLESLFTGRTDQLERLYFDEIVPGLNEELPSTERTFPEAIAYLIYTSGSTGKPKGVAIRHRNATAFFGWCRLLFSQEEMSGVFAGTSVCFDLSIFELFYTLSCGGQVILGRDALHLPSHPARDQVTLINTVPSAITELVRLKAIPRQVITVNLAGEPLKRALTDEIYTSAPWVQKVYNLYGPSEDTTYSTWALIPRDSQEEPTIGEVLVGSEAYILGPDDRILPDGEIGELLLGGLGVARGYLGRARQTAERFVPDPFSGRPGDHLYRTGDRVRRRPDGLIEYLGRFDHQVKIRGFRVELGEIEAALARHPAVEMPLALVREDVPGDQRIAAYFQLKGDAEEPSAAELRTHLAAFLPHYMMPAAFVALAKMPLNPNGKIDRAVLQSMPPPNTATGERSPASPRTLLEEQLLTLLAELLQVPDLGIYDSFFENGGHSLLATRATGLIQSRLGLFCPQRQIFETPTVALLAEVLEKADDSTDSMAGPIPHHERKSNHLPVSASQIGIFFLWLLEKNSASYNTSASLTLHGRLDVAALARGLHQLVIRHEALRCRFELDDGLPVAYLEPPFVLLPAITDLRHEADPKEAARKRAAEEVARPFDLLAERLVRAFLLRTGEEEHVFLIVQHHITTDGLSYQIFFRELAEFYRADTEQREPTLPALPITFFDFAEWQLARMENEAGPRLERWRQRLAGQQELTLPTDRPRPGRSARRGAMLDLELPTELAAAAEAFARQHDSTFYLVLSATFYAYLAGKTGQHDLTIGTLRSGRNHPDVEGLIGYFINPLPVRVQLAEDSTFLAALAAVTKAQLEAWDDEDIPFHQLAAALAPERQVARNPLFDVSFQVRDAYFDVDLFPGLRAEPLRAHNGTSKFDFEITLVRRRAGHTSEVEYDLELFDPETVVAFFGGWYRFVAAALESPESKLSQIAAAAEPAPLPETPSQDLATLDPVDATAPENQRKAGTSRPNVFTLERRIHELWCELLGLPRVDLDAHFFAIGGHSLMAARLIFRIKDRFGADLPLETIYSSPTIRQLAARVAEALTQSPALPAQPGAGATEAAFVPHDADNAEPVLSFGEERLFFGHLVDPDAATYNIPLAVVLDGELDPDALIRALAEIERRHEILRTIYVSTRSGILPLLQPADFQLHVETLAATDEHALRALADEEARRPFDLRRGPVWRVRLLSDGKRRHLLLVTFHHIVADGWSQNVFFAELEALYTAYHRHQPSPLPPPHLQMREYAAWQRARSEEIGREVHLRLAQLEGLPRTEIPTTRPRGEVFDSRGEHLAIAMDSALIAQLRQLSAAEGATLFQGLLATFLAFLARRCNTEDVAIGIPSAGRERPETERVIGFFVNTLVLRVNLAGDPTFLEILRRTHQALQEAQAHPVPFEKLVEALNPSRDPSRPVLVSNFFQVFEDDLRLVLPGLRCSPLDTNGGTTKFETDWAVILKGDTYLVDLECSASLFSREDAENLINGFLRVATDAARDPATRLSRLGEPELIAAPEPTPLPAAPSNEPISAGDGKGARFDGLERQLFELWRQVLEIEYVGLDDNFFDLGGHSLLLAEVLAELDPHWPELKLLELLRFPTVRTLAAHLRTLRPADPPPKAATPLTSADDASKEEPREADAPRMVAEARQPERTATAVDLPNAIAIVGMAGRFPGAPNIEVFWRRIVEGEEFLHFCSPEELQAVGLSVADLDPSFVPIDSRIEGTELFDPGFFGYSQREAELLDPQQRLFLECCWEALERSGHRPGGEVGVFGGAGASSYLLQNLASRPELVPELMEMGTILATDKDYLATRVAYKLDLRGPAFTVQAACSTSLIAVQLACRSLLEGDCSLALAGGVTLQTEVGYPYLPGGMVSPDGHCRPFDQEAAGMVPSSGVGVVVLRRLSAALADGDTIWAVIRGGGWNNDGAAKAGFTAPSVDGQKAAIQKALQHSGFRPESVGYIECHGTATPLGDAVEVAALKETYGDAPVASIALGSLKSQIGHMDTAAGVGGLIRTALALREGVLPPTLHFRTANPALGFAASPFYVAPTTTPWPVGKTPRRAGVSSYGIGGTNVHLLLEEPPQARTPDPSREVQLLLLSAKKEKALQEASTRLATALEADPGLELADVAYTLHRGRATLNQRMALVASDRAEAIALLRGAEPRRLLRGEPGRRPVYFLFPGQGSQHPGMAAEIYHNEPLFRRELDACCEVLQEPLGFDLRQLLLASGDDEAARRLQATELAQPALFAVEWSLACLLRSWGIEPAGMLGHSLGEFTAATLAGVFSRDAALRLVAARGRLVAQLEPGSMLALPLSEAELALLIPPGLSLATQNGPRDLVVSGPTPEIESFAAQLALKGVECRRLHTSHAFHSASMDPGLEELTQLVATAGPRSPQLPYLSNTTGEWITAEQAQNPRAWAEHLRRPVLFGSALQRLFENEDAVLLEVGPGRTLSALARRHPGRGALPEKQILPSLPPSRESGGDLSALLSAVGQLWTLGVEVDEDAFFAGRRQRRVVLPTYAFDRKRCFIDVVVGGRQEKVAHAVTFVEKEPAEAAVEEIIAADPGPVSATSDGTVLTEVIQLWNDLLGGDVDADSDFFDLGGHSLLALQLANRLRQKFGIELQVQDILIGKAISPRDQANLIGARPAQPAIPKMPAAATTAAKPPTTTAPPPLAAAERPLKTAPPPVAPDVLPTPPPTTPAVAPARPARAADLAALLDWVNAHTKDDAPSAPSKS